MLQIGMIVKILPDAEYSGKFTGYIGKGKNYFSQNKKVGVELFQQTNDASSKGLFWFSESKVVVAGTLPDAMMEYIKADLNATFGVANHIRPPPFPSDRPSANQEGHLQRPQDNHSVGRQHQNHCFLWGNGFLRLLFRFLCRCGQETVRFHHPRQEGFGCFPSDQ